LRFYWLIILLFIVFLLFFTPIGWFLLLLIFLITVAGPLLIKISSSIKDFFDNLEIFNNKKNTGLSNDKYRECPYCHKKIPFNQNVCQYCGKKVVIDVENEDKNQGS